jgi:hypothetical protein
VNHALGSQHCGHSGQAHTPRNIRNLTLFAAVQPLFFLLLHTVHVLFDVKQVLADCNKKQVVGKKRSHWCQTHMLSKREGSVIITINKLQAIQVTML